jgi:hypothetical protein
VTRQRFFSAARAFGASDEFFSAWNPDSMRKVRFPFQFTENLAEMAPN